MKETSGAGTEANALASVRIDIWLDVACVFKTRTQAKAACEGGKVHVDGGRAKPQRQVRPGDRLAVTMTDGGQRLLIVRGLADRSLPKAQARALYEDVTPPPSPEELAVREMERLQSRDAPGRPTARNRRELRRVKGRD